MDFSQRSYQKELLDDDDIPFEDIRRNMYELDLINTYLGGHNITIQGIKSIIGDIAVFKATNVPLRICEIGCGGGDNLIAIEKWCNKHGINVELIGIDIKKECIEYARSRISKENYKWIISDFRDVYFQNQRPSIIFSSLFCHHFTEVEVIEMLWWLKNNSAMGFFINDLHRHSFAYYSIKGITKFFSKSYLVKNDAPLSVLRGFSRSEWQAILEEAKVTNYKLLWKWAFRWLIVRRNGS
ncbi:MAG: SAM-dependent methyltransferase [Bacteroidetes bacterium]|nr:MAG: SAM-dependent methyltransferase [Bacteroidota bacterium]